MAGAHESLESMYPFVLSEDQEHLRREIRQLLQRRRSRSTSPAGTRPAEFPLDAVKKLGAMGLLGIIFPPEYGAVPTGYVDYARD